jgi:hypothetical protein
VDFFLIKVSATYAARLAAAIPFRTNAADSARADANRRQ